MRQRNPAVSGMFYESNKEKLSKNLDRLFSDTKQGNNTAVISPHAGYVYSGRTAAHAVASLKPSGKFIIMGPNHNSMGNRFSIMAEGEWIMPLGPVRIDSGIAKDLLKCDLISEDALAHVREHSVEVQLPLLQHRFIRFEFVPLCVQNLEYSEGFLGECRKIGESVASAMKKHDARLIASSDFSHYLPKEVAEKKDSMAIEMIKKGDVSGFFRVLEKNDASVCGFGPIAILMSAAKKLGLNKCEVINHTTSGDVTGDDSSVVAYYAIGFR
jgi:AmmeMemoRadiSam system protein B